jgi:hypothetical protein
MASLRRSKLIAALGVGRLRHIRWSA